jgi:hypothetical protein
MTNISAISSKLYSNMLYVNINPTVKDYNQLNDTVQNYICNNPIHLEHYKNSMDPKFNEYLNRLQSSIADYISDRC